MFKRLFRIDKKNNQSFFLFGPRGTGKTTWLKKNFSKAIYLDLLDSKLFRILSATPEKLDNYIAKNNKEWIILDEVQKIPDLLNEVHKLIEAKKYKFILTGSSARSLRRKGVNLLAGRALTYYFYPLTQKELGKSFSFQHSLKFGQLPMAYVSKNPEKFLQSYIKTYLKEEIQQEGLTRNVGNFARFLEVASFSQGELLSASDIAREAQLERKTVENYFGILDDLLLSIELPVFTKRAKRKLIFKKKFYYFDVGVFRALRPIGLFDSESELDGASLETLFLQEMIALNDYLELNYKIYFWRSQTGLEVNFVLYGKNGLIAIEIKRKSMIHRKDLNGLRAFGSDYPEAKRFVFCGVNRTEYQEGITILPAEIALKELEKIMKGLKY